MIRQIFRFLDDLVPYVLDIVIEGSKKVALRG